MRYQTISALKAGEVINLDGLLLEKDDGAIQPGDLYVAERNQGPRLLTAERIDSHLGCIFPTTAAYAYDIRECVKVRETQTANT